MLNIIFKQQMTQRFIYNLMRQQKQNIQQLQIDEKQKLKFSNERTDNIDVSNYSAQAQSNNKILNVYKQMKNNENQVLFSRNSVAQLKEQYSCRKSQYFDQYNRFFQNVDLQGCFNGVQKYSAYCQSGNLKSFYQQILYNCYGVNQSLITVSNKFIRKLQINILFSDLQSTVLELGWGYFKITISVLKIQQEFNVLHEDEIINQGTYGKIHSLSYNGQNYIMKEVKLMPRQPDNSDYESLVPIYSQYFINKIAGWLGISPKVCTPTGYDIILYKQTAIFILQQCRPIDKWSSKFKAFESAEFKNQLKKNLKLLHLLKICHCDIKPSNVMWDYQYQKLYFIDFGISQMVEQEIGDLTSSTFRGTYQFCSDEMKKIYLLKDARKIDLYYNDVYSLQKTFERANQFSVKKAQAFNYFDNKEDQSSSLIFSLQKQSSYEEYFVSLDQTQFSSCINILKARYYIFMKQQQKALQLLCQQKLYVKTAYKIFLKSFNSEKKCEDIKMYYQKLKQKLKENLQKRQIINLNQSLDEYFTKRQTMQADNQIKLIAQNLKHITLSKNIKQMKLLQNFNFLSHFIQFLVKKHKEVERGQLSNFSQIFSATIQKFYDIKKYTEANQNQMVYIGKKNQQNKTLQKKYLQILQYLLNYFISKKSKQCLWKLRLLLYKNQSFTFCEILENQLVNLPEIANSLQFYLLRIKFHLQRINWPNNIFLHGEKRWLYQIHKKIVIQNTEIQETLKSISQLVLSELTVHNVLNFTRAFDSLTQLNKNQALISKFNIIQRKTLQDIYHNVKQLKNVYENIQQKTYKAKRKILHYQGEIEQKISSEDQSMIFSRNFDFPHYLRLTKQLYYKRIYQQKQNSIFKKKYFQLINQIHRFDVKKLEQYKQKTIQNYRNNPKLYFLHIQHILHSNSFKSLHQIAKLLQIYLQNFQYSLSCLQNYHTMYCIGIHIFIKFANCCLIRKHPILNPKNESENISNQQICQITSKLLVIFAQKLQKLKKKINFQFSMPKLLEKIYHSLKLYIFNNLDSILQFSVDLFKQNLQIQCIEQSYPSIKDYVTFLSNIYTLVNQQKKEQLFDNYKSLYRFCLQSRFIDIQTQLVVLDEMAKLNISKKRIKQCFHLLYELLLVKTNNDLTADTRAFVESKIYLVLQRICKEASVEDLFYAQNQICIKVSYKTLKQQQYVSIYVFYIFIKLLNAIKIQSRLDKVNYTLPSQNVKRLLFVLSFGACRLKNIRIVRLFKCQLFENYYILKHPKPLYKIRNFLRTKIRSISFYCKSQEQGLKNIKYIVKQQKFNTKQMKLVYKKIQKIIHIASQQQDI